MTVPVAVREGGIDFIGKLAALIYSTAKAKSHSLLWRIYAQQGKAKLQAKGPEMGSDNPRTF